jgi:hypothetical protein
VAAFILTEGWLLHPDMPDFREQIIDIYGQTIDGRVIHEYFPNERTPGGASCIIGNYQGIGSRDTGEGTSGKNKQEASLELRFSAVGCFLPLL